MDFVKIVSNYDDPDVLAGRYKPPLFVNQRLESANIILDGKDKTRSVDNPWNFIVNINANMFRVRACTLQKVVMPKINNITSLNNTITIKHELGAVGTITLQPALYNTSNLCNEIASKMNAALISYAIADSFTVSFDAITKTFKVSSDNNKKWFFLDDCSFITRGLWCCNFAGLPSATVPVDTKIYSGRACLLYTRYITIHSAALNAWSLGDSATSSLYQGRDIIGVIDVCSIYTPQDFDISTPFSGGFNTIETPEAPYLNLTNSQKNLNDLIDVYFLDEWGQDMNTVMSLGAPYNNNVIGPTIWLEVYY